MFIYYRCQNVNRNTNRKSEGAKPCKRLKLNNWAAHPYSAIEADDKESHERNMTLLEDEMAKPKPRTDVLKTLMMRTYKNRFQELLNGDEPITASDYMTKYPLLKKPLYVSCII